MLSSGNSEIVDLAANFTIFSNTTTSTEIPWSTNSSTLSDDVRDICGANFCPGIASESNPNLEPPPPEKIQLISGIYLACMVIACLCVVFGVDSLKRYILIIKPINLKPNFYFKIDIREIVKEVHMACPD